MRDRFAGESHLEEDRGLSRRRNIRQARAVEDALEQRWGIDRPGQPAAHVVEAGASDDVIGAHTKSERDEMCGFDATVRVGENERG